MSDLQTWWNSLPPVTKWLMAGTLGVTLAGNFGFVDPYKLILSFPAIFKSFQIWRIITPFLFSGRLGFPFLMNLVILFKYSSSIETTEFQGRTADYVWMILFGSTSLLGVGYLLDSPILGMGLVFMILYYWSQKNPDTLMSFFFGITFKGRYLPWVMLAFGMLLGGGIPYLELGGIFVGHIFYFFRDVYPLAYGGAQYLRTPSFLYNIFPPTQNTRAMPPQVRAQVQAQAQAQAQEQRPRYFQGQGYVLGNR
eukprot:TRINITY_DN17687_c0_g1_i1.p1 TRINITY_DN17687_c0_g1~~TRINITY_DN17687_c0_g1_i1.p1  ORF type:complete len:252 (-),score=21.79 TRINITY_DN17687_c0_g1_i1:98-853(-)